MPPWASGHNPVRKQSPWESGVWSTVRPQSLWGDGDKPNSRRGAGGGAAITRRLPRSADMDAGPAFNAFPGNQPKREGGAAERGRHDRLPAGPWGGSRSPSAWRRPALLQPGRRS